MLSTWMCAAAAVMAAAMAGCGDGDDAAGGADGALAMDGGNPGEDAGRDATSAGDAGSLADAALYACDFDDPRAPGPSVLWAAPLRATGAETLGGHGHNDAFGPVGFCPGTRVPGQPFYRLRAAGFETDVDLFGDGSAGDDFLPVDFWRDAGSFTGYGESGGRVNVYMQVVDESGTVLNRDSNPEIRFERTIRDGPVDNIAIDAKPSNEFQTNFAMIGGGARYRVQVEGASDVVINMRLPVNHHVTYVLVFERQLP